MWHIAQPAAVEVEDEGSAAVAVFADGRVTRDEQSPPLPPLPCELDRTRDDCTRLHDSQQSLKEGDKVGKTLLLLKAVIPMKEAASASGYEDVYQVQAGLDTSCCRFGLSRHFFPHRLAISGPRPFWLLRMYARYDDTANKQMNRNDE